MDRRSFLTSMLAVAGAAAVATIAQPIEAFPLRPTARGGILDELDGPPAPEDGRDEATPVNHRNWHRRPRRRRRRVWRRYCRRHWYRGRRVTRCYRRRVWVWYRHW
ncbi:protamine-2 (modular protein) [Aminobacter sp. MDW-2]|uniref:protamine-2 (modular protein) n=1 Tax=Aminobacter sp. MDW-2 TaxID=2666139 RepID=UPI0012AF6E21|nr:protamine-2 (modular protein) [Aminobacter sp. MDW-2]MRX37159.1 protamine-2 (modular protein) [Aminobacter sp. MDW-2]QNH33291.1 protamine-2 (modular protein) [Aminobacter sp. MDW-2]